MENPIAFSQLGDQIVMKCGLAENLATIIPEKDDFGLMMLDADERIDRDFGLFFDKFASANGVFMMAHVSSAVRVRTASGSSPIAAAGNAHPRPPMRRRKAIAKWPYQ